MLTGLLRILRLQTGQPCDLVASGGWCRPLFEGSPDIGELYLLSSRKTPFWLNPGQRQLVRALGERPPGPVYLCERDGKSRWLLEQAGLTAGHIVWMRDYPQRQGEHTVAYWRRLAQLQPAAWPVWSGNANPPDDRTAATPADLETAGRAALPALLKGALRTFVRVTDADRADCSEWLQARGLQGAPVVLAQPGNKKTMRIGSRKRRSNEKYWPEANWAAVIDAVAASLPEGRVLICGAPSETLLARDILRRCIGRDTGRIQVATEDLPLRRLFALQEVAHSMISVDTGPAHSAAALGCPLVVMFGPYHPDYCAPLSHGAPVAVVREENGQASESDAADTVASPTEEAHYNGYTGGTLAGLRVRQVIEAWMALPTQRT